MPYNPLMTEDRLPHRVYQLLRYINDVILVPMFTALALELSVGRGMDHLLSFSYFNLILSLSFGVEWLLGLVLATDRKAYLAKPANIVDLMSALPLGHLFQGFRLARIIRLITRASRLVERVRRFRGKGLDLLKSLGLVAGTVFAGGQALRIVEPGLVDNFRDAMWWSLITMTTVGYGDVVPQTWAGKYVASALIIVGIGVIGYVAGFMSSLMADPDEDEILQRVKLMQEELQRISKTLEESR